MRYLLVPVILLCILSRHSAVDSGQPVFCSHPLVLDSTNRILPWYTPHEKAYDHFLRQRWDFILSHVPPSPGPAPRNRYPQYYFYCAFKPAGDSLKPDTWMNDIGEKIPNWFESARLYYAYTGDSAVMTLMRRFAAYTLEHGTSPAGFAWPGVPYTTTNAGDTLFRGFTSAGRFAMHEIQVDHAGDIGLTWYRMYQFTGEKKYLRAALQVADVLARYAGKGSAVASVWPYRVVMSTGKITAPYGANWTGCYALLNVLVQDNRGNVDAYRRARDLTREFLLQYPMKTGYWTDGHSDTNIRSNTYKSNMSASNMTLYLFDDPDLDPEWQTDIPKLIRWTEENFVFRSAPGEPSVMWGANIVGEQDSFLYKMDYQTARYAAACARWFAVSGDKTYREKAYRALNWVTYCNAPNGMAYESPVSKGILSWWSDCYGECPRMFYQAFAGVPEWAPPHENHILYSEEILKQVLYVKGKVRYTATGNNATDYLRLAFRPTAIRVNGIWVKEGRTVAGDGYTVKEIIRGDYSVILRHGHPGEIVIE